MKDERLITFVYESESRNYLVFNLIALILNLKNYLVFYPLILLSRCGWVPSPPPAPLPSMSTGHRFIPSKREAGELSYLRL